MRTRTTYYPPLQSSAKRSAMQLIHEEVNKLNKSGEQFDQVNKMLDDLEKRYKSTKKNKLGSYRYNLKIRLAVAQGVRNIYLEYARLKLAAMARLKRNGRRHSQNLFFSISDVIDLEMTSDVDED